MKRYLIILLILFIPLVTGLDAYQLCEDTRDISRYCTMVTPDISCSTPDYDIINLTGGVQENGTLIELNESIYYFNLTVPEGEYVIRLCDNSTREIRVTEPDDKMIPAIIILLPMILGLILVIAGANLSEDHAALRVLFMLLAIFCFGLSLYFGMISMKHFYDWFEMEHALGVAVRIFGFILVFIMSYFAVYYIYISFMQLKEKKRRKQSE